MKRKELGSVHLYILLVANGLVMFLTGLFFPQMSLFIDFMLGVITFFVAYLVKARSVLWRETRLFVITLASSWLGILLFRLSCYFQNGNVCKPFLYNSQYFVTLAFPFMAVLFLWLFYRLPNIIGKRKKENID